MKPPYLTSAATHQLMRDGEIVADEELAKLYARPAWRRRNLLREVDCAPLLYKYFSFDGSDDHIRNVRSVLVDSRLWLSKPSSFNDPFDFRCDVHFTNDTTALRKYFENAARKESRRSRGRPSERRKQAEELTRIALTRHLADPDSANKSFLRLRDNYGVCCFTTKPKSLLMWAHYAQAHTGLCFQFDAAQNLELFALARSVAYSKCFPELVWPDEKDLVLDRVVFRKNDIWHYENERRIVLQGRADQSVRFKPAALRGVIVGYRMSNQAVAVIEDILRARAQAGHPDVRMYRSQPAPNSYGMRICGR